MSESRRQRVSQLGLVSRLTASTMRLTGLQDDEEHERGQLPGDGKVRSDVRSSSSLSELEDPKVVAAPQANPQRGEQQDGLRPEQVVAHSEGGDVRFSDGDVDTRVKSLRTHCEDVRRGICCLELTEE